MTVLVKEGLQAGDLDGLVNKNFEVDKHKSKMGDDKDVCVLAFTVDGLEPAKDLERFAAAVLSRLTGLTRRWL